MMFGFASGLGSILGAVLGNRPTNYSAIDHGFEQRQRLESQFMKAGYTLYEFKAPAFGRDVLLRRLGWPSPRTSRREEMDPAMNVRSLWWKYADGNVIDAEYEVVEEPRLIAR